MALILEKHATNESGEGVHLHHSNGDRAHSHIMYPSTGGGGAHLHLIYPTGRGGAHASFK